jgi:hypothetical protein
MRFRSTALFGSMVIALAACDAQSLLVGTDSAEPAVQTTEPRFSSSGCYEYVNPTWLGGVATDPDIIAYNCGPETCGLSVGVGLGVNVDADGLVDEAVIQCPNNSIFVVPSTDPCWDCVYECGGSNCPSGALCSTIPGSYGSDCQAFTCPSGYDLVHTGVLQPPTCRRPCQTLTVDIDGPTSIQPSATCTWTANVSGGNGSHTIHWYNDNHWQTSGMYYTGGKLGGSTSSQFRVRVEVSDGSQFTSDEIIVTEDPNAMICMM